MEYKWKALSVTSVGSFMSAIDSTVVLLALVPITEDLHADYVTIVWIVIGYLLASTSLVLSLGRMGDMYGRKRIYNLGFVVFTIGSLFAALSMNGIQLVIFRAIEGIGSAMMIANSLAIISIAFPPNERGKAFGVNSIVWATGNILGIVLGGFIITFTTWRWIFLINVPIGIFGTLWAWKTLKETKANNIKESFDVPAAIAFTLGILLIQLGVTNGLLYGWHDISTIISFILSPFPFIFFLVWETRFAKDPIIDLKLFFGNRMFSASTFTATIQSLALFAVNFLLLFYLEGIYGLNVLTASYLIIPMALVNAIIGPFGGRLSDKYGSRLISTIGLGFQAIAILMLSFMNSSTPLWYIALTEAIFGIGGGLFWPSNTSAVMSGAPKGKYGAASGVLSTFRNTGMILSFAVALSAVAARLPSYIVYQLFVGTINSKLDVSTANIYLSAQSFAYHISFGLLIVAMIVSLIRPSKQLQGISSQEKLSQQQKIPLQNS
ncbi:drug resistance transporter, EmrB/QacA subfamily [Caldisphaera lagunensis DSM 15908]|uniref:Drug resistance transporter, EmrB/QacA subfamily n=1 Tax=Caldisphaera lagunensis (strain DSM 15908 / JCM 11604 / ANMR 0165 / IC-154) TaxID=1056495 RepID=L0AB16_CALLD|nr:MFS transporter [Caldisphaera lagunensis]AFZ70594.1 drug resistance transporter, EmrB/QacA subfamily [Caldisphaera lagunensis DSM 15908]